MTSSQPPENTDNTNSLQVHFECPTEEVWWITEARKDPWHFVFADRRINVLLYSQFNNRVVSLV